MYAYTCKHCHVSNSQVLICSGVQELLPEQRYLPGFHLYIFEATWPLQPSMVLALRRTKQKVDQVYPIETTEHSYRNQ